MCFDVSACEPLALARLECLRASSASPELFSCSCFEVTTAAHWPSKVARGDSSRDRAQSTHTHTNTHTHTPPRGLERVLAYGNLAYGAGLLHSKEVASQIPPLRERWIHGMVPSSSYCSHHRHLSASLTRQHTSAHVSMS